MRPAKSRPRAIEAARCPAIDAPRIPAYPSPPWQSRSGMRAGPHISGQSLQPVMPSARVSPKDSRWFTRTAPVMNLNVARRACPQVQTKQVMRRPKPAAAAACRAPRPDPAMTGKPSPAALSPLNPGLRTGGTRAQREQNLPPFLPCGSSGPHSNPLPALSEMGWLPSSPHGIAMCQNGRWKKRLRERTADEGYSDRH